MSDGKQDKRADYLQNLLLWLSGQRVTSAVNGEPPEWRASVDNLRQVHLFLVTDETRKSLKRIDKEFLEDVVRVQAITDGQPQIRGQEAKDVVKNLLGMVKSNKCSSERVIETPRLIGDADSLDRYALCRLDYSLKEEAKLWWDTMGQDLCPFLADVQESLQEPAMWDMLKCWIGKLLIEEASAPEVLIWFGAGGDGKTTFFQSMEHALNESVVNVISQTALTNQFNGSRLIDRRLIVVEEADDSHKIWTPELKMLTGNSHFELEKKYENPVKVPNLSMIAIVTNAEPALDKQSRAQLRRLRLIVSKPVVRTKVRTQQEIAEEFKNASRAFFGACVSAYLERGCVPVNSEAVIDELSEDTLGPVMSFARQHFKYEEGTFTHNEVLRDILTAHGSRHSLKNLKTAIGNLDKRIEINARRYTGRGIRNVAPTDDGFHGFNKPYNEEKVVPNERAMESLRDIWEGIAQD